MIAAMSDLSWPAAIVWVAVIVCFIGIPVLTSSVRKSVLAVNAMPAGASGASQKAVLEELRLLRDEIAELRAEVRELDRVLKSVE